VNRLSRTTESVIVGALVVGALLAWSVTLQLPVGAFNDDAIYVILGRSLASGAGYRSLYLVGAPIQEKLPPLWPAILALCWMIGSTLGHVKVIALGINLLCCGAAAGLVWWVGRVRLGITAGVMVVAVVIGFLLDPSVQYFTLLLSEPLFVLAWAMIVWLLSRDDKASPLALGALLACATLTRSQGALLIPAVLMAMALDGASRRPLIITALVAAVPVAMWHAGIAIAKSSQVLTSQPNEQSYLGFMLSGSPGEIVVREARYVGASALRYAGTIAGLTSSSSLIGSAISLVVIAAAGAGAVLLRKRMRVLVYTTLAMTAVVIAWPVFMDRFLIVLLPCVALLGAAAIQSLVGRIGHHRARLALSAAGALAAILILVRQTNIRNSQSATSIVTPSRWLPGNAAFMVDISRWAIANTRPTDRIAVGAAPAVWLYTGRQAELTEFAEPEGAPSVYARPGRFLIPLLASQRINVVIVESEGLPIAREVAVVTGACPNALTAMPGLPGRPDSPRMYRLADATGCVSRVNVR
jgi:hypothetical protein